MKQKLKNPPLVEAVCEFRFESAQWDWTVAGRLYEQIQNRFPERSQFQATRFELKVDPNSAPLGNVSTAPERVQLKNREQTEMVQVGPDLLAINRLKPYLGWEQFHPLIMEMFAKYVELAGSHKVSRIGLRYINQIAVPETFRVEDYVSLKPPLSGPLNRNLQSFYQRYEIKHDDQQGLLIHQTGTQLVGDSKFVMLDLDFITVTTEGLGRADPISKWISRAHDRVEEAFFASLNQEYLAMLKRGER